MFQVITPFGNFCDIKTIVLHILDLQDLPIKYHSTVQNERQIGGSNEHLSQGIEHGEFRLENNM